MPSAAIVCNMKDEAENMEHARLLRAAMQNAGGMKAETLSDLVGVSKRTVGNWISRKDPTMPSPTDRANLRTVFGDYMAGAGDPVEVAIRRSELQPWRQAALVAEYQRHLHEQQREVAG